MVTQEVADHLGSYSACPTSKTVHAPSCQEFDGHIPEPELPRGQTHLLHPLQQGLQPLGVHLTVAVQKGEDSGCSHICPADSGPDQPCKGSRQVVLSPSASQPSHQVSGCSALRSAGFPIELLCTYLFPLVFFLLPIHEASSLQGHSQNALRVLDRHCAGLWGHTGEQSEFRGWKFQ